MNRLPGRDSARDGLGAGLDRIDTPAGEVYHHSQRWCRGPIVTAAKRESGVNPELPPQL